MQANDLPDELIAIIERRAAKGDGDLAGGKIEKLEVGS